MSFNQGSEPKFCRDCAHTEMSFGGLLCTNQKTLQTDLVWGRIAIDCRANRAESGGCGVAGLLFTAKQAEAQTASIVSLVKPVSSEVAP